MLLSTARELHEEPCGRSQLVDIASMFLFLLAARCAQDSLPLALQVVWRSVEELQEAALDETPTVTLLTREQLGVQALQEESQASKEDVAKDLCTVREDLELLKAGGSVAEGAESFSSSELDRSKLHTSACPEPSRSCRRWNDLHSVVKFPWWSHIVGRASRIVVKATLLEYCTVSHLHSRSTQQ